MLQVVIIINLVLIHSIQTLPFFNVFTQQCIPRLLFIWLNGNVPLHNCKFAFDVVQHALIIIYLPCQLFSVFLSVLNPVFLEHVYEFFLVGHRKVLVVLQVLICYLVCILRPVFVPVAFVFH